MLNFRSIKYKKNNFNIYNMPSKMNMFISNGNPTPQQRAAFNAANIASAPAIKPSSSLNSSIIARIHNAKSGCGSCGKH